MTENPATADWTPPSTAEPHEWPVVPGYEIQAELGLGGMGIVYKARQTEHGRLVALKMIRAGELALPEHRHRFRVEAEAAARLSHSNVVQIFEVGDYAGQPYFAMEFIEAGSLDKYQAGRPQPASPAAELVRTIAVAVQHAHDHNIIHRDLKPANILLVGGGVVSGESSEPREEVTSRPRPITQRSPLTNYQPKIADFGLAKRLDADSTAWTMEGAILGTAGYMSPEQAGGRTHEVGRATDVYGLGAILYELLTGRPPFKAASWAETVQQVVHDEPTPPSRLQPDIPRDLEAICLKCLEKEPGRRYAAALDLSADLQRFLEGGTVAAVPLTPMERIARLAARDGYQVIAEIGRGPQSVTYHALYVPLKQSVALKVFPNRIGTREEWEAHLRSGAETWAGVSHPQVMTIHRAGWWDGAPFLAVEYAIHGSLALKVKGRPMPLAQGLRLMAQLAEVVAYLHRQGVTHGNLKPSNILLAADDVPRVADSRLTGGVFQSRLPPDDEPADGLGYVPPECFEDPNREPRPHTDVYGLGLILYEVLTGRPAFVAKSTREMIELVRTVEPVPPSRLNRRVTPHLDQFCLRCLRKNPWWRYARVYDVATGLQHFLVNLKKRAVSDDGTISK
jgi:serine/threonine protein kinase